MIRLPLHYLCPIADRFNNLDCGAVVRLIQLDSLAGVASGNHPPPKAPAQAAHDVTISKSGVWRILKRLDMGACRPPRGTSRQDRFHNSNTARTTDNSAPVMP